jgi:hypothetical protein
MCSAKALEALRSSSSTFVDFLFSIVSQFLVNEITPKDLVVSIARFAVRMDTVADRCAS